MACPVCGGAGWVAAAPISVPPGRPQAYNPRTGRVQSVPQPTNWSCRPLWSQAVIVPCFSCGAAMEGVLCGES
jgi:hypothetical protein